MSSRMSSRMSSKMSSSMSNRSANVAQPRDRNMPARCFAGISQPERHPREKSAPFTLRYFIASPKLNGRSRIFLSVFLMIICVLLMTACSQTPRENASSTASSAATSATTKRPVRRNEGENTRWAVFGQDLSGPSAASLAEAREMDVIQGLMDDDLYDQARTHVTALLESGCTHPQAFMLQAQLHFQQGRLDDAIPWCNRALAASSWWIEPRLMLAQIYLRLKRLAAAESVLADLDRLAPKLPWGPYGTGTIAAMRGDIVRATTLLDEALRRDPNHIPSLSLRARLAAQGKEPQLEEQLLGRYLAQVPDAQWAYSRLGELALAANRLDDAHRAFLQSYDLRPLPATARQLAELAQRRGDTREARIWQERAGTVESPNQSPPADP